jgi:hypothetical protein
MSIKISNLSHTSISQFAACPRAWAARYIEGIVEVPQDAALFGNTFDSIIGEELGFPVKEFRNADGKKEAYGPGEFRKKYSNAEVEQAVAYYLQQPWAWKEVKGTQVFVQITPDEWSKLAEKYGANPNLSDRIVGFIDLLRYTPESAGLDESLRPTETCDLKTCGQDTWKEEWVRQGVLYCLASGSTRFSIHRYVRGAPDKLGSRTIDITDEKGRQLVREVMDHTAYYGMLIKQVRDEAGLIDHLPRHAGWQCNYCALRDNCLSGQAFKGGVLPGKFKWARGEPTSIPGLGFGGNSLGELKWPK